MLDFTLCSLIFYILQVLIMSRYFYLPWMGQYVWFLTCSALFSKGNSDYEFIFVITSIILLKHMVIVDLKGDWKSSKRCDERRDRLTGRWEREVFNACNAFIALFNEMGFPSSKQSFTEKIWRGRIKCLHLFKRKLRKWGEETSTSEKTEKRKWGKFNENSRNHMLLLEIPHTDILTG